MIVSGYIKCKYPIIIPKSFDAKHFFDECKDVSNSYFTGDPIPKAKKHIGICKKDKIEFII